LLSAQEFPKGWTLYLEGAQGVMTQFHQGADLYTGSLQLEPQVTLKTGFIRAGAVAAMAYNNKKAAGLFGPAAAIKLFQVNAGALGSLANIQARVSHLWGTGRQRLLGGGIYFEAAQLLMAGIKADRDYGLNTWWFQGSIGFNLLHKKRPATPADPFDSR
jgi:hypothetical protein